MEHLKMINAKHGQIYVAKPFNHLPASIVFREACRLECVYPEQMNVNPIILVCKEHLDKLKGYNNQLRPFVKKRVQSIKSQRINISKTIKNPFTNINASIIYGIALNIERMLEKHYQLQSGETYVLLLSAATNMATAIKNDIVTTFNEPTTMKKGAI